MTRRQFAVPLVAAVLGSAITAAALTATGTGTGTSSRQQGLLASSSGDDDRLSVHEIYERSAPSVVAIRARAVLPVASPFEAGEATGPAEGGSRGGAVARCATSPGPAGGASPPLRAARWWAPTAA